VRQETIITTAPSQSGLLLAGVKPGTLQDNIAATQSKIEQAEQLYAMLSGQQVVFNRPSNFATVVQPQQQLTARGTIISAKDSGKPHASKPLPAGTHARTNTFDKRGVTVQQNSASQQAS